MIEYAATETDTQKRMEAYRKIIDIANENVYQIYTIHPYGIMAIRQSINGFVENPLNMGIYFYELSKSEAK
jgi:ABC-type transport system substrate-binding protein